ncbi:MAG: amidohydrolase [Lachnospiraceae bacterium]|nr:amidohydrolase [Lachnospiraceae bacterium]
MRIRFHDARILTMRDNEECFQGEVWVQGDKIEKVICGEWNNDSDEHFDQQIDCMGNLLMPGFKNCHAHGPMTFLRSFADDLPLQEWLNTLVFPAEAKLKSEDIYTLMQLAILEYVKGGITTSFEMYFHPEIIAKACIDMNYRVVLSGTVFGDENSVNRAMDTLRQDYDAFHQCHSLVDYRLGFHSEYSCCKELLKEIAKLSHQKETPVYMHNSETQREVNECMKRHGMTPVQLMNDVGLFEYGGAGHHLLYTDEKDREILREKDIYVVTNPSSNLKLASGIAPIKEYLDCGIKVAIGTDGPASNNSLNFFKEMYLVSNLQKVKYQDAAAIKPMDVLHMATVQGARLLGMSDCDCIEEGKRADMILIDLLKPNMQPMNHLVSNLIYSGSNDNVIMTMIAGKILYANGSYCSEWNPLDIYEKANYIIRRIEYEISS